jgi:hypothetical protein
MSKIIFEFFFYFDAFPSEKHIKNNCYYILKHPDNTPPSKVRTSPTATI